MKQITILLSVIVLLGMAGSSVADVDWTNESDDRLWLNSENWLDSDTDTMRLPDSDDKAAVRNGGDGPIVDSDTAALANDLVIGDWGQTGSVDINGGSLTTGGWLILGYGSNDKGTVNISGGTITCNQNFHVGREGEGYINMTGGTIDVAGTFQIVTSEGSGHVQLDGGTITCNSFSMSDGATMEITEGTLVVSGNVIAVLDGYVQDGWITAYKDAKTVVIEYDGSAGKTTVTVGPASLNYGNGDINEDGYVDIIDLRLFVDEWLSPDPDPNADFTRDGKVGMADFAILAQNWHISEFRRTLTGKIMSGYQGWFNAPGDGSGLDWVHWGHSNRFEPGYSTVDWWPDMSEFDEDEKYPTDFQHADGSTAYVFSSYNEKTVLRHFSWMADYGIDGIFHQRFAVETTPGSAILNHRDQVMLHCQKGANKYRRAWAMMYDLSGLDEGGTQRVIDDWKHLVDTYGISQDPTDFAYLHHDGKPVVAIWGIGFEGRDYTLEECHDLVKFFKNDPDYGGVTLMLGVPSYWRTLSGDSVDDPKLHDIILDADIVSPWAVGRYGSIHHSELDNYIDNVTKPDKIWCDEHGKEYLPVVFPGFSWHNMYGTHWDHIPRKGGSFLWRQLYKAISEAGVTMIYQAMFDEVDEGTAIFKLDHDPPVAESEDLEISTPFLPTGNAQFAPYDSDDALLPSDHYLWLLGEGAKMLRGEIPLSPTMPTR